MGDPAEPVQATKTTIADEAPRAVSPAPTYGYGTTTKPPNVGSSATPKKIDPRKPMNGYDPSPKPSGDPSYGYDASRTPRTAAAQPAATSTPASTPSSAPSVPESAPPAPALAPSGDDRVGGMATSETASASTSRYIKDSLDFVQQSFHWLNEAAQRHIDKLHGDLKKEDEPDWSERIAEGVLDIALEAGAAATGVHLALKLVEETHEVSKEFVKMLFEGGISAGVALGREKLAGGRADHVIDPFIESQKRGAEGMHIENQKQFIHTKRHQITTLESAKALEEACSQSNVEAAAEKQYASSRDAWVSYLAQSKYGAVGAYGPVQPGQVNVGPTTTNMGPQSQRERINKGAPGFVPDDAPYIGDALRGDAPGVLEVVAKLPEISNDRMNGTPEVTMAFLNGVNEKIREQYEGVALANMHIPRQVVAKVDGDAANFELNLDEKGQLGASLPPKKRTWLAQRAMVGHPEAAGKDEWEKAEAGRKLLLQELVPGSIKKPGWR